MAEHYHAPASNPLRDLQRISSSYIVDDHCQELSGLLRCTKSSGEPLLVKVS
jgi:hypothetical protein